MRPVRWIIPPLILLLVACGSSQNIIQPVAPKSSVPAKYRVQSIEDKSGKSVPSHFIAAVRGHLESELDKRQLLAGADGAAAEVNIVVNSYRMRSGVARGMFGMMAGKDGIGSTVTLLDPATHEAFGESTVSTFNVMAVGGEDDIARMHAGEIAKFSRARRKTPGSSQALMRVMPGS